MHRDNPDSQPAANLLEDLLAQSEDLYEDIEQLLSSLALVEPDQRELATLALCNVAFEHGVALRNLLSNGLSTSGVAMLRIQFEAMLRAAWMLHAATDGHVDRLTAPLTPESEQAAKNLPTVLPMIEALEKSGPRGSGRLLRRFHDRLSRGLNSFVHAGIHAVRRQGAIYPPSFLCDIAKNSNAVAMLTVLVMGELTDGGPAIIAKYVELSREHADVLPSLEPFAEDG